MTNKPDANADAAESGARAQRRGGLLGWLPEALMVAVMSIPVLADTPDVNPPTALLWGAALVLPFVWWRRHSDWLMAALVISGGLQLAFTDSVILANVTMLVALFAVALFGKAKRSVLWLIVVLVGCGAASVDWTRDEIGWVSDLQRYRDMAVMAGALVGSALIAWGAGRLLRMARTMSAERAMAARLAQEHDVRLAILAERAEIGREVHDIVGHALALIAVQAEAARYIASAPESEIDLPDADRLVQAADALAGIHAQATGALTETRALVRNLGEQQDEEAPRRPVHGVDDIPTLVSELGDRGIDAELESVGVDTSLISPQAQAAAYRIVQESLTNAIKHSDSDTAIRVALDDTPEALHVTVASDRPRSVAVSGSGRGLAGMQERARSVGGSFSAGWNDQDRFVVEAHLPHTGGQEGTR